MPQLTITTARKNAVAEAERRESTEETQKRKEEQIRKEEAKRKEKELESKAVEQTDTKEGRGANVNEVV